jgi:hypothetical protein
LWFQGDGDQGLAAEPVLNRLAPGGGEGALISRPHVKQVNPSRRPNRVKNGGAGGTGVAVPWPLKAIPVREQTAPKPGRGLALNTKQRAARQARSDGIA